MLKRNALVLVILVAAATAAGAGPVVRIDPADWEAPRLSTQVSVVASKTEGQYIVRAKVTDLSSSKVLATPTLVVAASQPATVEMGSTGATKLKMVFTVSADGKTATYTGEVQRAGEVQSSQQATLAVASGV